MLLGSLQDNHAPSKSSHESPSSRQQGADVSKPDDDALSQQHEDDVLPQQQSDVMVVSCHDDTTETTTTHNVSSDTSPSPPHGDDDTAMEISSEETKTMSLDIVKEFQGILHNEVLEFLFNVPGQCVVNCIIFSQRTFLSHEIVSINCW